jgi:hypothetical protein
MTTTAHTAHCLDLAAYEVQAELDSQRIQTEVRHTKAHGDQLVIPAWSATFAEITEEWLNDGVVACTC